MLSRPEIVDRPSQAYAFIRFTVPMSEMKRPADEGFPALFQGLARQGIEPVGAPFYNYRRIDMANTLDVEAGIPVARAGTPEGRLEFGELPGGRFVIVSYKGHYDGLYDATAMLIGWAKERGVGWDVKQAPDGDHFACRLEIYETDPDTTPDPADWLTRLAFKLADQPVTAS